MESLEAEGFVDIGQQRILPATGHPDFEKLVVRLDKTDTPNRFRISVSSREKGERVRGRKHGRVER